jgi:hypothetical protein
MILWECLSGRLLRHQYCTDMISGCMNVCVCVLLCMQAFRSVIGELAAKGDSRALQQQDEVDLSDKVTLH